MPLSVRGLVASQRIPRCYHGQPDHRRVLKPCSRCWPIVLLFVVASILSSAILRIRVALIITLGVLFWLPVCEIGRHVGRIVRSTRSGGFKKCAQRRDAELSHGELFGIWTFLSAARRDNYVGYEINSTCLHVDPWRCRQSVDKAAQSCGFLWGVMANDVLDSCNPSQPLTFQRCHVAYCILLQIIGGRFFPIVLTVS